MDALSAQLLNGHTIRDNAWQARMHKALHREVFNSIFTDMVPFATAKTTSGATQGASDAVSEAVQLEAADPYETTSDAQEESVDSRLPSTSDDIFVYGFIPIEEMNPDPTEEDTNFVNMYLTPINTDPKDPGALYCEYVRKNSFNGYCKVYGAPGASPLYECKLRGKRGSFGCNFFVNDIECAAMPPNPSRVNWLLAHICPKNGFDTTTAEQILGTKLRYDRGLMPLFEQLVEAARRECGEYVKRQSAAIVNSQGISKELDEIEAEMNEPDQAQPRSSTSAPARHIPATATTTQQTTFVVAQESAREQMSRLMLIQLLAHPKSVRYFNDECFRRLARYVPKNKLAQLPFQAVDELYCPLNELEQLLKANPLANCYQGMTARPTLACPSWRMPPWSFAQLLQFVCDYDLEYPSDDLLMQLVVLELVEATRTSGNHICVTYKMLLTDFKQWLGGPRSKIRGIEPKPIWPGSGTCKVHGASKRATSKPVVVPSTEETPEEKQRRTWENRCRTKAGCTDKRMGVYCFHSDRMVLLHSKISLDADGTLMRVLRLLALTPIAPNNPETVLADRTGLIVVVHRDYPDSELFRLMEEGGTNLDLCRIYTNENYQTEGLVLYVMMKMCQKASLINRTNGPIKLRQLDVQRNCCCEHMGFLNYSVAYHPSGMHQLPSKPVACLHGGGGRGKTEALAHLCSLYEPHEIMCFTYEHSQLDEIVKRMPGIRRCTMMRAVFMHTYMCGTSMEEHTAMSAGWCDFNDRRQGAYCMKSAQYNYGFEVARRRWEVEHPGEPFADQESFNFDFPFERCPFARLKCVIFEEAGKAPLKPALALLGAILQCAPGCNVTVLCGDPGQLGPRGEGNLLQILSEGFGFIEFEHMHRQEEGPINDLSTAALERSPGRIKFDGKQTYFKESDRKSIVKDIVAYHQQHGLKPLDMQAITHTNALRKEIAKGLQQYYRNLLDCSPREKQSVVMRGEGFVFKRNLPGFLTNNSVMVARAVVRARVEKVPQYVLEQRQEMDRRGNIDKLRASMRNFQAESRRHAAAQHFELTTSELFMQAGILPEAAISASMREVGGLDAFVRTPEVAIDTRMGGDSDEYAALSSLDRIPDSVFAKDPYFDQHGPTVLLPCASVAIRSLLKHCKITPTDESVQQTQVRLLEAGLTPVSFEPAYQDSAKTGRTIDTSVVTLILATPYHSGQDLDAPFDRRELVCIPYTKLERPYFECCSCGTVDFTQGKQFPRILLAIPDDSQYFTNKHLYTFFTRARPLPNTQSVVVMGSHQALLLATKRKEPERFSDTGGMLKAIADVYCKAGFDPINYHPAAELEKAENGRYGVREITFAQLAEEQREIFAERAAEQEAARVEVESIVNDVRGVDFTNNDEGTVNQPASATDLCESVGSKRAASDTDADGCRKVVKREVVTDSVVEFDFASIVS